MFVHVCAHMCMCVYARKGLCRCERGSLRIMLRGSCPHDAARPHPRACRPAYLLVRMLVPACWYPQALPTVGGVPKKSFRSTLVARLAVCDVKGMAGIVGLLWLMCCRTLRMQYMIPVPVIPAEAIDVFPTAPESALMWVKPLSRCPQPSTHAPPATARRGIHKLISTRQQAAGGKRRWKEAEGWRH